MFAPEQSVAEEIGIRWAILGIAAVGHGAVIVALMNPHARPFNVAPVRALIVSVIPDQAPTKAPLAAQAVESRQPELKPAIKTNKSPPKPSGASKATPIPTATESPVEEAGDATPTSNPPQPSISSGTARTETTASPAGTTEAEPGPLAPPRFDADYLSNPAPPYPAASRAMGEQGKVLLNVLVSPTGTATEIRLRSSSGFVRLDHAAQEAVRWWKFVPARQGGEAVAAWVVVPILFSLRR